MHDNELWQIYNNNGTPVDGKGAPKEEFNSDKSLVMSNAHVWFWKIDEGGVSILLQKRSLTKPNKPGWFHISAGGILTSERHQCKQLCERLKRKWG